MNKEQKKIVKFIAGLEIHITLNSEKKIFNWMDVYNGTEPVNSKVGPWELGFLGTLPIINPEVIEKSIILANSLEMSISDYVIFDRKIYNYFDLPKGYQITQKNFPIAKNGKFILITKDNKNDQKLLEKEIPIKLIQLEEDTAKSYRKDEYVKIDFNRSGNPLIELVTDPVFTTIEEISNFIDQLRTFLIYNNISNAKMEYGQLRFDLNISFNINNEYITNRFEIKNLNSLLNIKKVIEFEIQKHIENFNNLDYSFLGPYTLSFDEKNNKTSISRNKQDYLFIPEFNIPPIRLSSKDISSIIKNTPKPIIFYIRKLRNYIKANILLNLINNYSFFKVTNIVFSNPKIKEKIEENYLNEWVNFYLNYLSIYFKNNLKLNLNYYNYLIIIFTKFVLLKIKTENLKSVLKGFFYLVENNKKINIESLIKKNTKILINTSASELEITIEKCWDELKLNSFINKNNTKKVFNLLLGKIKQIFPNTDIKDIIEEVNKFLLNKTEIIN